MLRKLPLERSKLCASYTYHKTARVHIALALDALLWLLRPHLRFRRYSEDSVHKEAKSVCFVLYARTNIHKFEAIINI